MNFGELLIENRSKNTCLKIVKYVEHDPHKFQSLVDAFFQSSSRKQNLIMWALNHVVDNAPELMTPHLSKFIHLLESSLSDAVKRGIIRILRDTPEIPEELAGEVYTKCFDLVMNPKEPIAVRAFGIKVLTRIGRNIPELQEELIPLFQDIYDLTEKGLQNSAGKALITLKKSNQKRLS